LYPRHFVALAGFLILPWIESKNLASKILAAITRRLPYDWENQYHLRPVLLETFVDSERFSGTCYKAANWIHVGKTKGRGKLGPAGKQSVPIKDIWLYPLRRDFRERLTYWFDKGWVGRIYTTKIH